MGEGKGIVTALPMKNTVLVLAFAGCVVIALWFPIGWVYFAVRGPTEFDDVIHALRRNPSSLPKDPFARVAAREFVAENGNVGCAFQLGYASQTRFRGKELISAIHQASYLCRLQDSWAPQLIVVSYVTKADSPRAWQIQARGSGDLVLIVLVYVGACWGAAVLWRKLKARVAAGLTSSSKQ